MRPCVCFFNPAGFCLHQTLYAEYDGTLDHLYSVFEYNDAFVSLAQEYLFATEDTRAAIRGRYNTALELFPKIWRC